MARSKATLGDGPRLTDYLSTSLLACVFPAQRVYEALEAHGRNSQRIRRFPAVPGVYFTISLSLYPQAAYTEVFKAVAQGLAWASGAARPAPVSKSSISSVRSRIGWEPLRDLMRVCCQPLADQARQPRAFFRGLRVVAMDGTRMELADESDICATFGRPGSRTGHAGYPQATCVVLVECATHVALAAELGPYKSDEWTLCRSLLGALEPGMLLLADRGFNGFLQWQEALSTGAQLLWRVGEHRVLPVKSMLSDGSYLSEITPSPADRAAAGVASLPVRVIEYSLPGAAESAPRYRLITSLLQPEQGQAQELAALYHQRWHVESVFDELKTHLRMSRRTLRSKTADLVRQEFFGWMLAHYAVRWLLHQGASHGGRQDEELSFTVGSAVSRVLHRGAGGRGAGVVRRKAGQVDDLRIQRRAGRIGRVQAAQRHRAPAAAQRHVAVAEVRVALYPGVGAVAHLQAKRGLHAATQVLDAAEPESRRVVAHLAQGRSAAGLDLVHGDHQPAVDGDVLGRAGGAGQGQAGEHAQGQGGVQAHGSFPGVGGGGVGVQRPGFSPRRAWRAAVRSRRVRPARSAGARAGTARRPSPCAASARAPSRRPSRRRSLPSGRA